MKSGLRNTANAIAYESLRKDIINMVYKPGQELNVINLAQVFSLSKSTLREALLQLGRDNLVDVFPQKGSRVSFLNKDIIKQERFMRLNLELGVISSFMDKLEANDSDREILVTKLKSIILQQHAALLSKDIVAFLDYDDEMHHLFYSYTDNEWIWNILSSHTGNEHRIRILSHKDLNIIKNVEEEHNILVEAIQNKDKNKAIITDRQHLKKLDKEMDLLEKDFPEYFSSLSK
ncbi:MAG: GntR family transcriptional regulator [Treponema sp.]|nr:GntR family transcriptional regulator [Treponema sp.]